jgi:hypothetical protein
MQRSGGWFARKVFFFAQWLLVAQRAKMLEDGF